MSNIAFLGTGAMGRRMAMRLLEAGHSLTVWNRTAASAAALVDRGARLAASPREAVAQAEFVISMLTDDAAAAAVWTAPDHGAVHGLKAGTIALECSTLSPAFIRRLGADLAVAGVDLIDAPVAGSLPQAEAGQLIIMAGGDAGLIETASPVLAALAQLVLNVGEPGQGAVLKLAVNTLFAAQIEILAELLGFLGRTGFAPAAAAELLGRFPIVAPPLAGLARMMAAGSAPTLFTIDLISKDLGYTLETADRAGANMPATTGIRAVFETARTQGLGGGNISRIATLFA